MKVRLGGYNIDAKTIRELSGDRYSEMTPEIISASYARISRDPREVGRLREEARKDIEKARSSNRTIVFGLGHSSIAEHAVFNFDVMGISRLAVESVEHFRLASFTEKSQRYIRLGRDFVVPEELMKAGLKRDFNTLMRRLAEAYQLMYESIRAVGEEDETAKEDARYLMPLSTTAQFGMTVNARELEYMISRLSSHPLSELREFASKLSKTAGGIAPSLVKYPDPTDYFKAVPSVREEISGTAAGSGGSAGRIDGQDALLIDVTPDADRRLAASLIFASTGLSHAESMRSAAKIGKKRRAVMIASTMRDMKLHDSVWREFENIRLLFEVTVSSSCFAQLKRHRMATIIAQDYLPSLGVSIPLSVRKAGKVGLLREMASSAFRIYRKIGSRIKNAQDYALLNAHRRRVLFDINLRELYHFSRLRSDIHAQWEIRSLSERMCRLAEEAIPSGSVLLCGKDSFDRLKKDLFG
jgi:flavin-dependent thymidylate synthase